MVGNITMRKCPAIGSVTFCKEISKGIRQIQDTVGINVIEALKQVVKYQGSPKEYTFCKSIYMG
ncbi:protein of unknown function [Vibrio tapetis subsp. tapetis]|uniref:Uncharacterized protein n=1 Tax=Vibrio tapetis subsp. tapetis TaxID=1671868 RepID=A0A2N8ZLR7_9VIBR|nr:protein of unknown function [Vibrio tapetis subsp. tapetis]